MEKEMVRKMDHCSVVSEFILQQAGNRRRTASGCKNKYCSIKHDL
jgi:hypothetical protein